jgi:HlyD family secretion protein
MKKRLIPVVVILAVAAGLWAVLSRRDFSYAGTVEATVVDISPQVVSVIEAVDVKEGDAVKAGQTLVRLKGEDIRLAAELAERDFMRAQELHKKGSIPDEAFDRTRFKRDDAALKLSWCTLTSPIDGTVLNRYHEPGELVNPSLKLLTLANLREVWAYVYVPQPLLAKLTLNRIVRAWVPETRAALKGRVAHISDQAEFTPRNVQTREERTRLVYAVKVLFDNSAGTLKPGMTIETKLLPE